MTSSKTAGEFKNFAEVLDVAEGMVSGNWEETFVGSMSDKYKQYGDKMYISDKQLTILVRIAGVDLELAPPKPKPEKPVVEDGKDPF